MTLTDLIREAGLGPWTTFPEWRELLIIGEAVATATSLPIDRARFIAEAAADLNAINPERIQGLDFSWALKAALNARRTPTGPREIWGSVMEQIP